MRGRLWFRGGLLAICMVFLLSFQGQAASQTGEQWQQEMGLEDYDFTGIQQYLDQAGVRDISFMQLMKTLMSGDFFGVLSLLGGSVKHALFDQVGTNTKLMAQIIVLGILSAVFSNFSSVFQNSQISETGFFVTYLLLFTFLTASFLSSVTIAGEVLTTMVGFMKVLVPSYFLAVAFAGGSMTSAASYQVMLLVISGMQWLFQSALLPLVRVYIMMILAGNLTKEDLLSKMTELLGNVIQWGVKTMVGLVLGFQILQGLVLPYADAVKNTALHRLVSVIPGIGQGANAISQMVLGSGVLIKNTMGAAAVVILFLLTAIPVLKLVVLMFLYQGTAAMMQPVCDKRIVTCIYDVGKGHRLLLRIVISSLLLFVLSIAVVCLSTNASFYAG